MSLIRLAAPITITSMLIAAAAFAQSGSASGQAGAQGNARTNAQTQPATQNADAAASVNASADASAKADAELRHQVTEKAAKVSAKARAKAEDQLELSAKSVDATAASKGESEVASRLGAEFGMTTDAITSERTQLDASWGNLMIAHTLAANSKTDVTAAQLIAMKKDGMGWGQIAAGLGFDLGSAIRASKAESRVAAGEAKSNGHVAVINGEGAKAGVGADANLNAATRGARVKAGADVGAGVKIGH